MQTPYGKLCQYYYADYYRGKETQECRLVQANAASEAWTPALCQTCPVPDILLANACPHLVLRARVGKTMLGLLRKIDLQVECRQYRVPVARPHVGCGHCHEFLDRPTE